MSGIIEQRKKIHQVFSLDTKINRLIVTQHFQRRFNNVRLNASTWKIDLA